MKMVACRIRHEAVAHGSGNWLWSHQVNWLWRPAALRPPFYAALSFVVASRGAILMISSLCILLSMPCLSPVVPSQPAAADTIRLEVGAKQVNGRVYAPHAARVRVRVGADD